MQGLGLPPQVMKTSKAMSAALSLLVVAAGSARASSPSPKPTPEVERAETESTSRRFEGDAASTKRRAKQLTDSLRVRGKGPFLENMGVRAVYEKDYTEANKAFGALIDAEPQSRSGYHNLATSLFMSGDYSGAAAMYGEALKRSETRDQYLDVLALKAEAHLQAGNGAAALSDTEEGLADPRPPARMFLVRTRALLGVRDTSQAAATYLAFRKTHPRLKRTNEDAAICRSFKNKGIDIEPCRSGG